MPSVLSLTVPTAGKRMEKSRERGHREGSPRARGVNSAAAVRGQQEPSKRGDEGHLPACPQDAVPSISHVSTHPVGRGCRCACWASGPGCGAKRKPDRVGEKRRPPSTVTRRGWARRSRCVWAGGSVGPPVSQCCSRFAVSPVTRRSSFSGALHVGSPVRTLGKTTWLCPGASGQGCGRGRRQRQVDASDTLAQARGQVAR